MSGPDITRAIVQQVDELTETLIKRNKRIADLEAEVEQLCEQLRGIAAAKQGFMDSRQFHEFLQNQARAAIGETEAE